MLPLKLSIILLKSIRSVDDRKEYYYDSDTYIYDFVLHAKFFTVFYGNALGFKARDLDLVVDLTDRAQQKMEDDDLTEDALRRLAPGNE